MNQDASVPFIIVSLVLLFDVIIRLPFKDLCEFFIEGKYVLAMWAANKQETRQNWVYI